MVKQFQYELSFSTTNQDYPTLFFATIAFRYVRVYHILFFPVREKVEISSINAGADFRAYSLGITVHGK